MRRKRVLSSWLSIGLIGFGLIATAQGQIFTECVSNGAVISGTSAPVMESILVGTSEVVLDVQVSIDITHSFVGDLEVTLTSPASTSVTLHDNQGTSEDDMNLIFSDQGVPHGSAPFSCGCLMQPSPGLMSDFAGEDSAGTWTLTVGDTASPDSGILNQWCLNLYDTGPLIPISDLSCTSVPGSGLVDTSWTNGTAYDTIDVILNGTLEETLPGTATSWTSPMLPSPSSASVSFIGRFGGESTVPISCSVDLFPPGTSGPDVVYTDCVSITNWGALGGIRGYSLGSYTCNIGDMNLQWGGGVTPLLGMNAFRLADGRLEQIGMSWLKNGTVAAAGSGCGLPCSGPGGSLLGPGCRDVYGSSYNGGQSRLGPRSAVNAYTGAYPGAGTTTDSSVIGERLQVTEVDLSVLDALYFIEGVYVAPDDATFSNRDNNASYKRVTVDAGYNLDPQEDMQVGIPAIEAWRDHGLGLDNPDLSVETYPVDVPGEGRFHIVYKVTDLGGEQWLYDYAIYNLSSHRSGGSFSVPVPPGVTLSMVGFHDVDYHSGEPYDNTDWTIDTTGNSVTWTSPETFAENANSNALRFGTMYNFYFTADAAPGTTAATLGLFRPGTPDSISFNVSAPEGGMALPLFVRGDCNDDSTSTIADPVFMLSLLFPSATPVATNCSDACDANDDGAVNVADPVWMLESLFAMGPPPPSPWPGCGIDPTADPLDCFSPAQCP